MMSLEGGKHQKRQLLDIMRLRQGHVCGTNTKGQNINFCSVSLCPHTSATLRRQLSDGPVSRDMEDECQKNVNQIVILMRLVAYRIDLLGMVTSCSFPMFRDTFAPRYQPTAIKYLSSHWHCPVLLKHITPVWCHTSVIPQLRRLKGGDPETKDNLCCIAIPRNREAK